MKQASGTARLLLFLFGTALACRAAPLVSELRPKPSVRDGFSLVSPQQTGILFSNNVPAAMLEQNRILENGSGVALGDVDGDGWCDIYFCSLTETNRLYRNLGNWKFEDVTQSSGVGLAAQHCTGACFADVDGDGDLDLLVNALGGGTRLFLNDGKGHFTEATDSGLNRTSGATSFALADVDGDGDLDLYVVNYRTDTIRDAPPPDFHVQLVNGKPVASPADRFEFEYTSGQPQLVEKGEPDSLYLNDGHGHFTPVSWTEGAFLDEEGQALTSAPQHWGLSATFRDFNGDHIPDLYVCNDFAQSPDDIWIGLGGGKFRRIARLAIRNTSWASMSVDVADINRDGLPDIMVVDMLAYGNRLRQTQRANLELANLGTGLGQIDARPQNFRNTLFLNRGDGTFAEIAQLAGIQASDWSWSLAFMDVDLDGFEDVLIATGNAHDISDADTATALAPLLQMRIEQRPKVLLRYPPLQRPKLAFRNNHDLTFSETGAAWGFNQTGISHGMAFADLDNDGDLDVVVNNFNSVAGIYENVTAKPRIAVRLHGKAPNTDAIGAMVALRSSITQSKELFAGGRYLSSEEPFVVFAALTNRSALEVRWPDGKISRVENCEPNHRYDLSEDEAVAPAETYSVMKPKPWFENVSALLQHIHSEKPFDDYRLQQLVPQRFSQMGPGVAWADLNADGFEDIIIGSGQNGTGGVFLNRAGKTFSALTNKFVTEGDEAGVAIWKTNAVLLAQSNYEGGGRLLPPVNSLGLTSNELQKNPMVPGQSASVGAIALADVDGDGDLDLFVGSRLLPGRFPEPSISRIYVNKNGKFVLDRRFSLGLASAGMVSGAVFSDLDGDGNEELLLACDCGPIRVFRFAHGICSELTTNLGLAAFTGRWNGISTGDFDGDGRMDIIASNWGRNSKYQRYMAKPVHFYYGDLNHDGRIAIIEAFTDPDSSKIVPWRSEFSLARSLPFLTEKFPTYRAFAEASVAEILGDRLRETGDVAINTFDTMLFLNRGDHFEAHPLPIEAQFAPAFGISVADFDGDGNEDIFLAQNFFAVLQETSRFDAGRGLLLRGNGRGDFTAVPGQESGLLIYGEQRGCAVADFDHDGRVDLLVAQNSAETVLYRNVGAKPGLRVTLHGSVANPLAIGAKVRLMIGEKFGPACELHSGSGYWSQDAMTQVMAAAEKPTGVWVQWPGGKSTTNAIPAGAMEMHIDYP